MFINAHESMQPFPVESSMDSFHEHNRTSDLTICTLLFAICACVLAAPPSLAIDAAYSASWGLDIGEAMPDFSAVDQDGASRDLESLAGPNGLLLFFNRSADW